MPARPMPNTVPGRQRLASTKPKLAPHIDNICLTIAHAVGIDARAVSVKGKTNEKVGALGRNEAIAVHAVAMLAVAPERSLA